jgi:hypothetical protein
MTVTNETVKQLDAGDVSYAPVEQVSSVVDGLLVPTLDGNASSSAASWPAVVSKDVSGQGHV